MKNFKYNFLLHYGKLEQYSGMSRAAIRQQLADDLGIVIETFRRWEKTKVDEKSPFSKSDIEYCCKFLGCTESEFINQLELETVTSNNY